MTNNVNTLNLFVRWLASLFFQHANVGTYFDDKKKISLIFFVCLLERQL